MRTWPALEIQQADDDDLIQAFLIDFNLAAIEDSRFFFQSVDDRHRAAVALRANFPGLDMRPVDVPDEDWATRSQAALGAVTVGALTIAPPWDVPGRPRPAPTDPIGASPYVGAGSSPPPHTALQRVVA